MSWLLCYIFYTAAVFITLLFWTMLYEASEGPPTYFNLYVHGLQARFWITCTFANILTSTLLHIIIILFRACLLSLISLSQTDSGTLKRYGHVSLLVLLMLYSMWSTGLLVDWILGVSEHCMKTTFLSHILKLQEIPMCTLWLIGKMTLAMLWSQWQ